MSGADKFMPLSVAKRIDEACDQFEAGWKTGKQPQIETFLAHATDAEQSAFLRALLRTEIELLARDREPVPEKSYAARFPNHLAVVNEVLASAEQSTDRAKKVEHSSSYVRTFSFRDASIDTSRPEMPTALGKPRSRPKKLGRFKILKILGEGAFGTVYHARDPKLEREVALKVPRAGVLVTQKDADRFLQEARSAAELRHPHICPIHDFGKIGDDYFIVMSYIAGKSLSSVLAQGKQISDRKIAVAIRKIALGLGEAHQYGIVHRDLKPANIMIDRRGEPVVMDFGLARRNTEEEAQLTHSGAILGTPAYMPPEQARGDSKAVGPTSDVYSLGVIMYELMCGQRPFQGGVAEIMAQILYQEPQPPSVHRSEVDPTLEAICLKAMAKKAKNRYQSMSDFAQALTDYLRPQQQSGDDFSEAAGALISLVEKESLSHKRRTRRAASPWWKNPKQLTIVAGVVTLVIVLGLAMVPNTRNSVPQAEADGRGPESFEEVGQEKSRVTITPSSPGNSDQQLNPPATDDGNDAVVGLPWYVKSKLPNKPNGDEQKTEKVAVAEPVAEPVTIPSRGKVLSHEPRTHIIGVQKNQFPDLNSAIEKAQPGDTILIQHRGPLEFAPVDLSGKTPLTIVGGSDKNGTDYWPILRQIPANAEGKGDSSEQESEAAGLFHAERLNLKLKKLHLAVAGPKRKKIAAVFSFTAGRVELDQCTVTAGVQRTLGKPPGDSFPFIRILPPANGLVLQETVEGANENATQTSDTEKPEQEVVAKDIPGVEVVLNRTFIRGLRLQTCIDAQATEQLEITATQTIWAGGSASWLAAQQLQGPLRLSLDNCTIYNTPSFLEWNSHNQNLTEKPAIDATVKRSLFVGPYANKAPFIAWETGNPEYDVRGAAADGTMAWHGENNVFHRYGGYFRRTKPNKLVKLGRWLSVWKQANKKLAREADPMFRIWPDGLELQETIARDFQPRFWRNKKRSDRISEAVVGAVYEELPHALVSLFDDVNPGRMPSDELFGTPRGQPRILRVHQKEGPYKTLEAAFAEVCGGDIIEITDNGPYAPKRNFDTAPANAVLSCPSGHLTLRAADGVDPVIYLRDDLQKGTIPHPRNSRDPFLALLSTTTESTGVTLEGIHFRASVAPPLRRSLLSCPYGRSIRITSCSFMDAGSQLLDSVGGFLSQDPSDSSVFLLTGRAEFIWFENDFFHPFGPEACWSSFSHHPESSSAIVRNCICNGIFMKSRRFNFQFSACTILGMLCSRGYPESLTTRDNFIYGPEKLFSTEIREALGKIHVAGANNCLWIGRRTMTAKERSSGAAGLFPGPVMKSLPVSEGASTPKDPYRRYRLKRGQLAGKMSADGGPVGVRIKYLPKLPAVPPVFFQMR